ARWTRRSFELPAHNDARDADRGLRIGDRRALAIFSTSSSRVAEIGADHVDFAHELGALANQRGSSEWLGELSISYPVALGDLECENARDLLEFAPGQHLYVRP